MILIDTGILIEHIRKKDKIQTSFFQLNEEYELGISMMTAFEFLIGKNEKNTELIEVLMENLSIFPWDEHSMQVAVQIYQDLKKRNQLIEIPDIIIASTAIALDIPLATRNRNHFERIQNLQLVDL